MSVAYSRKQRRQMSRPYLRIRPCVLLHTRLWGGKQGMRSGERHGRLARQSLACEGMQPLQTELALPHLLKSSKSPHVLNLSPPIALHPKWLKLGGVGYSMAKFNLVYRLVVWEV